MGPSHEIKVETACKNVTTAGCSVPYGKRAADPQVVVGAPAVLPYHNGVNTVAEHCYPVTKVEPTTVTEKSRILKAEIECTDVVVAKIPKVTCTHGEPAVAEE